MYVSQLQFKQSVSKQKPQDDKLSILTYFGMGVISRDDKHKQQNTTTTRPSNKHLRPGPKVCEYLLTNLWVNAL